MARRRRRNDSDRVNEESFFSSNPRVVRPLTFSASSDQGHWSTEDRREYHPDPYRPPATYTSEPAYVSPSPISKTKKGRLRSNAFIAHTLSFNHPKKVLLCVKRKTRREVLLALGRGNGRAKKHRNHYSKIRC